MIITSVSNEKVKKIRALSQKKFRESARLYVAEGVKPVSEAIKSGQKISLICGVSSALLKIPESNAEVLEVTGSVFGTLSGEINPEGVLAVIGMPDTSPKKAEGNSLLLDGVSDPGNLGTIIRTAAAAGYKDIYLLNTADPFNPKTVRASMSGIFFVNLYAVTESNFTDYVGNIIAADMHGENVFAYKPRGSYCIAVGSEAHGLSAAVKSAAKTKIALPMEKHSESLNAAVAAGIIMYVLNNNKEN